MKHAGAAYFITFRLADSLPGEALEKLKHEREAIVQNALAAKRPLTWHEEQQLFAWYSERVEKFLDSGIGDCWLKDPEVADMVACALNFFDETRYSLHSWVIMPNHVHAIVWPHRDHTLSAILHSWKSFTSKEAAKLLNRPFPHFWQKESYDHWLRNDEERARLGSYIANNPVAAGLCKRPEDWPWSSANPAAARFKRK